MSEGDNETSETTSKVRKSKKQTTRKITKATFKLQNSSIEISKKSISLCQFHINLQSSTNGTNATSEGSDFSEDHDHSPKINHKPFFRRLSFKALRKGKVIKLMVMSKILFSL